MSPSSCAFLAGNGFDFNVQFRNGIVYEPGNDPSDEDATAKRHTPGAILRSLVTHILSLNKPIIVHNGLLDLMFIYQALYAELPKDLGTFVADMTELFPGGLYDTKYIADYVTREKASFLSYLYRKWYALLLLVIKVHAHSEHIVQ